jgi:hypothetical protein
MIKIIAYLGNVIFIVFVFTDMPRKMDAENILILIALLSLPAINTAALLSKGDMVKVISLYFQRKKLEQEKRIKELQESLNTK